MMNELKRVATVTAGIPKLKRAMFAEHIGNNIETIKATGKVLPSDIKKTLIKNELAKNFQSAEQKLSEITQNSSYPSIEYFTSNIKKLAK